jgi:hypothetical protein
MAVRADRGRGRRLRVFGHCLGHCRLLRFGRSVGWRLGLICCGLGGGGGRGRRIAWVGFGVSVWDLDWWLGLDGDLGEGRYFLISAGVELIGTSRIS